MLHSSLRMTERYDQWKRIRRGEVQVVLGTRSAIFAPLKNLGLIVLDEEQESSYQSENPPRYHARDIAKYLCARDGATAGAGLRHPGGGDRLARQSRGSITRRCCAALQRQSLPQVMVADLRQEIRNGNAGADRRGAPAGAGGKPAPGRAEHSLSEPPGQQPDAAVRRVRPCAGVSPVQRGADLSLRQRAADVPLLRPLRAGSRIPARSAAAS